MKKAVTFVLVLAFVLALGLVLFNPVSELIRAKALVTVTNNPTTDTMIGASPFGMAISNQFARKENVLSFRRDVFRGLPGSFNAVGEVRAAVRTENSAAWEKAFELMIGQQCPASLDANAQAERSFNGSQPWLAIHVNTCQCGDEEIRRHLEKLDEVPVGTYDTVPLVRYRTHWVTRIAEVTEAEYKAADNFRGWSPTAPAGLYRAKYAVRSDRYFVLEIFEDEAKWARLVVHTYENPTKQSGFSVGGVRHDDLSIVLPKEPCQGSSAPAEPTTEPTATPTLEPKSPHKGDYVQPAGVEVDPLPVETPNEEPTDALVPAVTAAPTAEPTQAPTEAPAPVAEVEPEPQVQTETAATENFPGSEIEPLDVEPALGEEPNDDTITDPFG